ncbi:murein biosynthesis integral membrane protein MurJ [Corynebacterium glucuronolyticum]|uniref:murein biosynthesis integral membrane protein MurJ n=1 Tax=Corynebacterium glucuronolyticum TaxID=39791 RepID=UPI00058F99D2|nr:murein biosynthesis integral membrane protein MurJ [Corynebacterium glucuronolyticum]QRO82196.1 hypothetical protein I6J20_10080 [Corynebacterium glucuronolyticum]
MACVSDNQGARRRIVAPTPPAPVPSLGAPSGDPNGAPINGAPIKGAPQNGAPQNGAPNAKQATPESTKDAGQQASDADVVRSTGSMAIATLISRMTGFLRNLAITATLGAAVASTFNAANVLPNLITEIVLGAVLTALVVPVLVRAQKEDADGGAEFIRRLATLTFSLLAVVTVLATLGSPLLTFLLLGDGKANTAQATSFAYLLLPQIFFYGVFALFMAICNTRGVFKPGAWAPVLNNVVCLATFALYWLIPGDLAPDEVGIFNPRIALLGLGTTLGVVVQTLIMLPALKKLNINLKPLWGLDARLKQFGGMAMAIVVYVAISQIGYFVTINIAAAADAAAPNIYMQAWLLLQMPYGIIGVTLLTAIMPRLSRNAAEGDDEAVVADLTLATRLTFMALIPVVIFMTFFGPYMGRGLFGYLNMDTESANLIGITLAASAFTLLPYAAVLLHLRVFYAREEAWTPTYIIAGITITKIALSMLAPVVASSTRNVVVLLGAANGFGFLAGAIIGTVLLRRKLGHLGNKAILKASASALGASLVGIAVAFGIDYLLLERVPVDGSLWFLIRTGISGIIFLAVTGVIMYKADPSFIQRLTRRGSDTDIVDTMGALPPMSAGEVRRPRLVPGAPILSGRFRLLRSYGGWPGASLWMALDTENDAPVSLTFTDRPTSAPGKVVGYRYGSLIINNWVKGKSLDEAHLDAEQAARAAAEVASLEGVHSTDQLRIGTDGSVHNAFPIAGLTSNSRALVASTLDRLLADAPIPPWLSTLRQELADASGRPVEDIARDLTEGSETFAVTNEFVPAPPEHVGFGARDFSAMGKVIVVAAIIGILVLIASLTMFLVSVMT